MPVIVDEQSLPAEQLGLTTVGQVLTHLRNDDRLVITLLIDGKQPSEIGPARKSPVTNKTLYIETVRSADIARQAIDEAREQLGRTDPLRLGAAEILEKNQISSAMDKLGAYFESLAVDPRIGAENLPIAPASTCSAPWSSQNRSLTGLPTSPPDSVRSNRRSINRDFVSLTDQLLYEAPQTCQDWLDVLARLRNGHGLKFEVRNLEAVESMTNDEERNSKQMPRQRRSPDNAWSLDCACSRFRHWNLFRHSSLIEASRFRASNLRPLRLLPDHHNPQALDRRTPVRFPEFLR